MIVVADASPLHYLIQIKCAELLEKLYGRVFVPNTVIEELSHAGAPAVIAAWLSHLPRWIEVRPAAFTEPAGLP